MKGKTNKLLRNVGSIGLAILTGLSFLPSTFVGATDAPIEETEPVVASSVVEESYVDTTGIDFSSCRLLVVTRNADVQAELTQNEGLLSSYNDVFLLQFASEEEARSAYQHFWNIADIVEVDSGICIAEDAVAAETVETNTVMTETDNPLTELSDLVAEGSGAHYNVALIDTGAGIDKNVSNAVSVIGDFAGDDNGHGTKMKEYIVEQNENVNILSIKALDFSGTGDISSVFAAIEYAKAQNVDIINLSISALASADSAVIEKAVDEAVNSGIIVIGAAGNNGKDASFYVPGGIYSATIIGAANEDGSKNTASNFGASVDYNVVATSTSAAAAKMSGWISKNGMGSIEENLNKGLIFDTSFVPSQETEDPTGPDDPAEPTEPQDPVFTEEEINSEVLAYFRQFGDDFTIRKIDSEDWSSKFHAARTANFYAVQGVGDNDVLFYGYVDGQYTPAYCISHGYPDPIGQEYYDFSWDYPALGYIMKNGYPNQTWGLNGYEAQFLTQSAVFAVLTNGAALYNTVDGMVSQSFIYDNIWGAGRFYIAENLYNSAVSNAAPADAAYAEYWADSQGWAQSIMTPITKFYGNLQLLKVSAVPGTTNDNACYSLAGAKYGVYNTPTAAQAAKGTDIGLSGYSVKNDGRIATFITDASGVGHVLTNGSLGATYITLETGKYYVTETAPAQSFKLDTQSYYTATVPKDSTVEVKSADPPIMDPDAIKLKKYPFVNGTIVDTLDGIPIAGAKFQVEYFDNYNASGTAKRTWIFESDKDGIVDLNNASYYKGGDALYRDEFGLVSLPLGSVRVTEIESPAGYQKLDTQLTGVINQITRPDGTSNADFSWNADRHLKTIATDGEIRAELGETPKFGDFTIIKNDIETEFPQGDGSFDGITYQVRNITTDANGTMKDIVMEDGTIVKAGEILPNGYAVANGQNSVTVEGLPLGTYEVIEKFANDAYLVNEDWVGIVEMQDPEINNDEVELEPHYFIDGKEVDDMNFINADPIRRGGVSIQKISKELQAIQNQGLARLENCEIEIVNASENPVLVNGVLYSAIPDGLENQSTTENSCLISTQQDVGYDRLGLIRAIKEAEADGNGAVVATLVTDSQGFATTEDDTLPYGTYYLYESKANATMLASEEWIVRIEVREDGVIIDTSANAKLENEVVRGDIYFTKVDEDGVLRPNTPFLLVAYDAEGRAIEAHVIVTDSMGIASTSYTYNSVVEDNMITIEPVARDRDENVNRMDRYVKKNADGSYSITPEGEEYLANGEASTWGIWFSQGLNTETNQIIRGSKGEALADRGALYYGNYQLFEIQCQENSDKQEDLLVSKPFAVKKKVTIIDDFSGRIAREADANAGRNELRYVDEFVDLEVYLETHASDVITKSQVTFANQVVELQDVITYDHLKSTSTYKWVVDFVETGNPSHIFSTVTIDNFKPEDTSDNVNTVVTPAFVVKTSGEVEAFTDVQGTHPSFQDGIEVTTTGNVDLRHELDEEGMDGKSISVIVHLYEYIDGYDFDSDEDYKDFTAMDLICSFNEDTTDKNEIIYIPAMSTLASDIFTKDHVGTKYNIGEDYDDISTSDAIIDEVTMKNLGPKEKYMLIETLMDKDSGEIFDEKQATYTFYSDRDVQDVVLEKKVEMPPFEVDSKDFDAKTLVVFEQLWRVDDNDNKVDEFPVVTHEVLLDEDQSVHYIEISTLVKDMKTTDHVGEVTKEAGMTTTITDKVDLENLIPGQEYTIKGEYVFSADCTDANGVEHKAGEAIELLDGSIPEVTFIAEEANQTIEIVYVIDSSMLEGITMVSTEYAYHNDILIDKHVDLTDEFQCIHYPKVRTAAIDGDTKDDVGTVKENATITDTVDVWNLISGMTYTISGKLMCQETGEEYEQAGVEMIPCTFTAESEHEQHVITFTGIDSTQLKDKSLVVFETLTHNDVDVARHTDISDTSQTIHYPDIHTTAVDSRTGDHVGSIFGRLINAVRKFFGEDVLEEDMAQIIDTVQLNNLVPGRTYTASGVLMNRDTGEPILIDGEKVVQTAEITVGEGTITAANGEKTSVSEWNEELNRVSGTVDLTYTFDSSVITGTTTVVFEDLFHNGINVVSHSDLSDDAQAVNELTIDSVAVDKATSDHVGDVPRHASTHDTVEDELTSTIVETIAFEKLVKGEEYTIDAAIVVRDDTTDKPMYLKPDGTVTENREEAVRVLKTFTADAETLGVVSDDTLTTGYQIICDCGEIFEGASLADVMAAYGEHWDAVQAQLQADEITLEEANGHGFTGVVSINMEEVEEDTFSIGGTIQIELPIESELVAGKTLVVVDDIYHNDVLISKHADIDNELQSVHYPKIETSAYDVQTGDIVGTVGETEITDIVTFENLLEDQSYTISGTLVYQEDVTDVFGEEHKAGDPVLNADGEPLVAEVTLDANEHEKDGFVELTFVVESEKLAGLTVVAFEELWHNDVKVDVHADILDEPQTVHFPDLCTSAIDTQTQDEVGTIFGRFISTIREWFGEDTAERQYIADTVSVKNLVPGQTYTISGILMDKKTGWPIFVNGHFITSETTITVGEGTIESEDGNKTTVTSFDADTRTVNGTVEMTFRVDSSVLGNYNTWFEHSSIMVAFETLYHNGINVARHCDLDDEAQTIYNATIRTTAIDSKTEDRVGDTPRTASTHETVEDDNETAIVDTVAMRGLVPGKEYLVTGYLVSRDESTLWTPMYLKADGTTSENKEDAITASTTFTAEAYAQDVKLIFPVSTELVEGRTVVVFETLYHNDIMITAHANIVDEAQSVYYPEIHTNAANNDTTDEVGKVGETTITDVVSYKNLIPSEEYTIVGHLVYKEDVVDAAGNILHKAGEQICSPETTEEIPTGNTILVQGYECTCGATFETLEAFEAHLGEFDLTPDDVAWAEALIEVPETETITVASTPYEVTAILKAFEHGPEGTVELVFNIDSTAVMGESAVVFEELWHNGVKVAVHADIEDESQTIHFPKIETSLRDTETGSKMAFPEENITLTDTVAFTNLVVGKTYTLQGQLMNKETGEPQLDDNGEEIWSEPVEFVPEEVNGFINIDFTFSGTGLAGQSVVAFETLYHNDIPVAVHADINDEEQTVHIPEIGTQAKFSSGLDVALGSKDSILVDTIDFKNLVPGVEYEITTTLMNKETGEPIMVDDKPLTTTTTFTPALADGSVDVMITIPREAFYGTLVVFEQFVEVETGKLVAIHEDIEDEAQTVFIPEVGTKATFKDGSKSAELGNTQVIKDVVGYKDLTPGKYVIKGYLMNKKKGTQVTSNRKPVVAETAFEIVAPEIEEVEELDDTLDTEIDIDVEISETEAKGEKPFAFSGEQSMEFTVPFRTVSGDVVVFEEIYKVTIDEETGETIETLIGEHKDINDKDQTVTFIYTPPTGDFSIALYAILGAVALLLAGSTTVVVIKRKKDEDDK